MQKQNITQFCTSKFLFFCLLSEPEPHIPGAPSFDYLKTYEGNILGSFREACIARGLLDDDTM